MISRFLPYVLAGLTAWLPLRAAIAEPEPIRVVVGMIETDSAAHQTMTAAEDLQAIMIESLSKEPRIEVLARDKMEAALNEIGLRLAGNLAPNASIAVGRWLNAGILIAGSEVWEGNRRARLDFEFIDLLNGNMLARCAVPLMADDGEDLRLGSIEMESLNQSISVTLHQAAETQRKLAGKSTIAPLFFFNDQPGLHDLDAAEEAFLRAAEAQNRFNAQVYYPLLPRAIEAANERTLTLEGLSLPRSDGMASLAACYVWGFYREISGSEVPFAAVEILVTLHLWSPSGGLTIVRETMPAADVEVRISALLGRITAWTLDPKAAGSEAQKMELSASDLAIELFRAARLKSEALQPAMLKSQRTQTDLYRWGAIRQLVAAAHFFDPSNWLIARELVVERHNDYFSIASIAMKVHPRDGVRAEKQELQASMDFLQFLRRYGAHPLALDGNILTREDKDFVRLLPGETLRPGELDAFRAGKNIGLLVPYVRSASLRNGLGDNRLPHGTLFPRLHERLFKHVQTLPEHVREQYVAQWQKQLISDSYLLAAGLKANEENMAPYGWQLLAQEIPSVASHLPAAEKRRSIELWIPLFVSRDQIISEYRLEEWRSLIRNAFAEPADALQRTQWLDQAEKMKPKPPSIVQKDEGHGHTHPPPRSTPAASAVIDLPPPLATQPEKVVDLNYKDASKIYKRHYREMVRRMGGIVDLYSHGVRAMLCQSGQLYFTTDTDNADATGALPGIWRWRFGSDTPDFLTLDLGIDSRIKALLPVGNSCWLFSEGAGVFSTDQKDRFTQKAGLPTETIRAAVKSRDRIYVGGGEDSADARFGYYSMHDGQWTAVAMHPVKANGSSAPPPQVTELAASGSFVAVMGRSDSSYLHLYDTLQKTWIDLWPPLAKHLGNVAPEWELPPATNEPRATAIGGERGGLWIGSPHGLFHYDPQTRQVQNIALPSAWSPDRIVADGSLVVVAASPTGVSQPKESQVFILDKQTSQWVGAISMEPVTALTVGEGFLWMGTDCGSAADGARIFRVPLAALTGGKPPEGTSATAPSR